jgi:hypothetical protein
MNGSSSTPSVIPLAPCPHCGREVPVATFCGACGSHLTRESSKATRRHHAYAAFPEEPVLRMAVTSSLFPHLSQRSKVTFRAAIALIVIMLVALALVGVQAPSIAVSALGIPLIYLLYLYEIDEPSRTSVFRSVISIVVIGVGLGTGWGLVGGHFVNEALAPTLNFSLVSPAALSGAVAVPVVSVLLMIVSVSVVRLYRRGLTESLDGFVLGAIGALAFTSAATITQLSSLLSAGQFTQQSFTGILTQVVIRGLCSPMLAAALIGLFGASIWSSMRPDGPAERRWLGSPAFPVSVAVLLEIGLGFADIGRQGDPVLLVCHLAALGIAIAAMRVGLHYVLLHEEGPPTVGAPGTCGHCHFVVPTMHFCPHCGVARSATAPSRRPEGAFAHDLGPVSGA